MTDPRDARIASLVEQRDIAWAALRENNLALALADAKAAALIDAQRIADLEDTEARLADQITTLNATVAALEAQIVELLGGPS